MYDSGKIIFGLIIFLGLFTYPIWFNIAGGKPSEKPNLILPQKSGNLREYNGIHAHYAYGLVK